MIFNARTLIPQIMVNIIDRERTYTKMALLQIIGITNIKLICWINHILLNNNLEPFWSLLAVSSPSPQRTDSFHTLRFRKLLKKRKRSTPATWEAKYGVNILQYCWMIICSTNTFQWILLNGVIDPCNILSHKNKKTVSLINKR